MENSVLVALDMWLKIYCNVFFSLFFHFASSLLSLWKFWIAFLHFRKDADGECENMPMLISQNLLIKRWVQPDYEGCAISFRISKKCYIYRQINHHIFSRYSPEVSMPRCIRSNQVLKHLDQSEVGTASRWSTKVFTAASGDSNRIPRIFWSEGAQRSRRGQGLDCRADGQAIELVVGRGNLSLSWICGQVRCHGGGVHLETEFLDVFWRQLPKLWGGICWRTNPQWRCVAQEVVWWQHDRSWPQKWRPFA